MSNMSLTNILDAVAELASGQSKVASAADPSEARSLTQRFSADEMEKFAAQIEARGHVNGAAERIVAMQQKVASQATPDSDPFAALELYLEFRKVAHEQAMQNLGLAPKTAEDNLAPIFKLIFAGDNPLEKLSEVAAYYYVDRLTGGAATGGR